MISQFKSWSCHHWQWLSHQLILSTRISKKQIKKINSKISSIREDESIVMKVRSLNSRILKVKLSSSQKSAIIVIKLIISKKTVEKKILSNIHKNSLINQIQIWISSQIQLLPAIKVDNLRNQFRFRQWKFI